MNFSSVFRFGRSPGKLQIAHVGPQHQLDIAKDSDSSTRPVSTCLDLSRAISAENEFSKSAWFLRGMLAANQKVSVRTIRRIFREAAGPAPLSRSPVVPLSGGPVVPR